MLYSSANVSDKLTLPTEECACAHMCGAYIGLQQGLAAINRDLCRPQNNNMISISSHTRDSYVYLITPRDTFSLVFVLPPCVTLSELGWHVTMTTLNAWSAWRPPKQTDTPDRSSRHTAMVDGCMPSGKGREAGRDRMGAFSGKRVRYNDWWGNVTVPMPLAIVAPARYGSLAVSMCVQRRV